LVTEQQFQFGQMKVLYL